MSSQIGEGRDIIIRYLGKGSSGSVFDVFCGQAPCHDIVKIPNSKGQGECNVLREVKKRISRVRNPVHRQILERHFVTYTACSSEFIVMPHEGKCILADIVTAGGTSGLILAEFNLICQQVITALCLFHYYTESAHMDIKINNILVVGSRDCNGGSSLGRLKLFDFDLCLPYQNSYKSLVRGTASYLCPVAFGNANNRYFARQNLFQPCEIMVINDLWGLLLSLYIVVHGRHLFANLENQFVTATPEGIDFDGVAVPSGSNIFYPKQLTSHYFATIRKAVNRNWLTKRQQGLCQVFFNCFDGFMDAVLACLAVEPNGVFSRRESFVGLTPQLFFQKMFGFELEDVDSAFYQMSDAVPVTPTSLPPVSSSTRSFTGLHNRSSKRDPIVISLPSLRRGTDKD